MKVFFSKAAELELKDAVTFYNEQSEGLGFEFANEVKRTINRITGFVNAWPLISENTRRARTNKFPYGIIYSYDNEKVIIIAVMHLHRKPNYWKSRL